MKTYTLILVLLITVSVQAQIYPFSDGFSNGVTNQIPAGWQGDMKIYLAHGTNDSKAIAAKLNSINPVDSLISPLIGPLTYLSTLTIYYRIIDQNIYPSTTTNLNTGDLFTVELSNNTTTYQTILQIDENNHNPNFNFLRKKVFLSQFAGDVVNLKLRCQSGGQSYFVDIDSVVVKNDVTSTINEVNTDNTFTVSPNPVRNSSATNWVVLIADKNAIGKPYILTNIQGQTIKTAVIVNTLFEIETSFLANGIYFLQIADRTKKLVVN